MPPFPVLHHISHAVPVCWNI